MQPCPICGWTGHPLAAHDGPLGGAGPFAGGLVGSLGDHRHTTPSEFYAALAAEAQRQEWSTQAQRNAYAAGLRNAYLPPEYDVDELNHATRLEF